MNFKIIETPSLMPDILLYRNRDENGTESVNIVAIGTVDNQDETYAMETIIFENPMSAKRFIIDFSQFSAAQWCEKERISY